VRAGKTEAAAKSAGGENCSTKAASRSTCKAQQKANAATAITFLEDWSEAESERRQNRRGGYPRQKSSKPSLLRLGRFSVTERRSRSRLKSSGTDPNRLKPVLESARCGLKKLQSGTEAASALSGVNRTRRPQPRRFRVSFEVAAATSWNRVLCTCGSSFSQEIAPHAGKAPWLSKCGWCLEATPRPAGSTFRCSRRSPAPGRWSQDLIAGRVHSVDEIAKRDGVAARYVRELIALGFLAPGTVEAIIEGHQPPELTVIDLPEGSIFLTVERTGGGAPTI